MDKQTRSSSQTNKPTVIYICSPFRPVFKTEADRRSELGANIERTKAACKMVAALGCMPMAAHIYFTQFLNDRDPVEREKGMALGLQWLEQSDELWIFGNTVSDGMAAEIARAKELGMPVRCISEPCRAVEILLREILGDETKADEHKVGDHNAGETKANAKNESED